MIVKNESNIIRRLLESVLPIIDGYCICDTGSTDNTIELITKFFNEHKINGKIVEEPFRDFGYNRTFALKACQTYMPHLNYILLLDADMILTGPALKIPPEQFKQNLTQDMYHIYQGNPKFYYKNVRIIKNNMEFTYWGVTHEYVNSPPNATVGTINRDSLFINDIGDGGAKGDKTERDIRLLIKGLEDNPNNDRYTFYLANSYKDSGQNEKAIETYKKRVEIGGWIEEVWFSHYNIGNCYMRLNEDYRAIMAWMDGYNAYPNRIENLYKIIEYYRVRGKNRIAYEFYLLADKSRKKYTNWSEYLFLERDVYDYKIDYEFSILGYYVNENQSLTQQLIRSSMHILNYPHLEETTYKNVMNNYKFYTTNIISVGKNQQKSSVWEKVLSNIGKNLVIDANEFVSSTPSMIIQSDKLIVNVRYVNYRIDERGGYVNRAQIKTVNVIAIVDIKTIEIENQFILGYNEEEDAHYVGLEDIRLHEQNGTIYYNANRGLKNGEMKVEHGKIDLLAQKCENAVILQRNGSGSLEKNWVLLESQNTESTSTSTSIVYGWSPLIIGKIEGDQFIETEKQISPSCFKYLRGSTNGIKIGNEIWFFCHAVSYEDRRYYYHMVVVLDANNYKIKKYTPYFTFEREKVEYTLGFSYFENENELLVGYSIYDKTTKYAVFDKTYFDNMMYLLDTENAIIAK
jgi:tetratricopeptide (TPR) repeat protein